MFISSSTLILEQVTILLDHTQFYVPASLAKETPLTNEREKVAYSEALAEYMNVAKKSNFYANALSISSTVIYLSKLMIYCLLKNNWECYVHPQHPISRGGNFNTFSPTTLALFLCRHRASMPQDHISWKNFQIWKIIVWKRWTTPDINFHDDQYHYKRIGSILFQPALKVFERLVAFQRQTSLFFGWASKLQLWCHIDLRVFLSMLPWYFTRGMVRTERKAKFSAFLTVSVPARHTAKSNFPSQSPYPT